MYLNSKPLTMIKIKISHIKPVASDFAGQHLERYIKTILHNYFIESNSKIVIYVFQAKLELLV